MKIYKILNDYLRNEIEDGKIDFVIRARIGDAKIEGNKDAVYFYIHPLNKDGDTQDYRLEGGQMFVDMGIDVAEPCPQCGCPIRHNSETGTNVLSWTECTVCKWTSGMKVN